MRTRTIAPPGHASLVVLLLAVSACGDDGGVGGSGANGGSSTTSPVTSSTSSTAVATASSSNSAGTPASSGTGQMLACNPTPETAVDQLVDMTAPGFVLQKSFNQGTLGASVQGQSDGFDDAAGSSVLTDEICYRGGRGVKAQVEEAAEAFGSWGGIVTTPEIGAGDEIWIRVRTYWPEGFDTTAYYNTGLPGSHPSAEFPGWPGVLKFLRLHTVNEDGQNGGYDDVYLSTDPASVAPLRFIYEGEQVWSDAGQPGDKIAFDTWETYELYLKLDDVPMNEGGQARVRIYKDGTLLLDAQDRQTLGGESWTAKDVYLFTYWNNGAPKSQHMYIDDVVVTTKTPLAQDADGMPFLGTE